MNYKKMDNWGQYYWPILTHLDTNCLVSTNTHFCRTKHKEKLRASQPVSIRPIWTLMVTKSISLGLYYLFDQPRDNGGTVLKTFIIFAFQFNDASGTDVTKLKWLDIPEGLRLLFSRQNV